MDHAQRPGRKPVAWAFAASGGTRAAKRVTGTGHTRQAAPVTISRTNPADLHLTPGYHHVTVVSAGRTAYLAGQVPLDSGGAIVGVGDVAAQVDQVAANVLVALGSVGVGPEQVVRTVIYVVSSDRSVLAEVWRRFQDSPLAPAFTSASTLLGVAQLGFPDQLVELDVTAALP